MKNWEVGEMPNKSQNRFDIKREIIEVSHRRAAWHGRWP